MENPMPSVITPPATIIKFTGEEMKEVAEVRDGFDKAALAFGKLHLQKKQLEKVEKELDVELDLLMNQEKTLADNIVKKYGDGTYDPATGIFTPNKK
jgi:hypothetical protein